MGFSSKVEKFTTRFLEKYMKKCGILFSCDQIFEDICGKITVWHGWHVLKVWGENKA